MIQNSHTRLIIRICVTFGSGVSHFHDLIQACRRESQTSTFRQEMHRRAAIEGTLSELVRAHAVRRARYRGLLKN